MVRLKEFNECYSFPLFLYFNSTMVRLKVCSAAFSAASFVYFNSTMVRLKGFLHSFVRLESWYFNSTMVRLKVQQRKRMVDTHEFQFHYGTIKSSKFAFSRCEWSVFQFHYGTIKSLPAFTNSPRPFNFNSTMVRLKVGIFCRSTHKCNNFNSTMVRLKGKCW